MKFKNKVLAFIAPAATVATFIPLTLTSCNKDDTGGTSNSISYSGETSFDITTTEFKMEFTLEKALGKREKLFCTSNGASGKILVHPTSNVTTSGTKATVTLVATGAVASGDQGQFGLVFSCRDSSLVTELWSKKFDSKAFTVTYKPA